MTKREAAEGSRITLVTYGHLRASHEGADGSTFELAEELHRRGRLERVISFDCHPEAALALGGRVVSPARPIFAAATRVLANLAHVFPNLARRTRERVFDWLVSSSPLLRNAEVVVFRKPNFVRSAEMLRHAGVPVVAVASILHPRMNHERVRAEAMRLGIRDRSLYSDGRRMLRLERFFESCDSIVTSESVGATSFTQFGIEFDRIAATPLMNGADCLRFVPSRKRREGGPFRVLHISSMNLIKGVARLFEVWRDLALPDAELVLGGSMDESVRSVLERVNPPNHTLLGSVSDTPSCYRTADVFVSPSLSDSAPNTVLEALASGLPVIVSDACGASELVEDGRTGFVYAWNDTDALADRIAWCHTHQDRLAEMGRAAREVALENSRGRFAEVVVQAVDSRTPRIGGC